MSRKAPSSLSTRYGRPRRLRTLIPLLLVLSSFTLLPSADPPALAQITDYREIFLPFRDASGTLRIAIRQYVRDGRPFYLVVHPDTLATSLHDRSAGPPFPIQAPGGGQNLPYLRALTRYTNLDHPLQNDGLKRGEFPLRGVFLTVDLCPSRKPLDRTLFIRTAALSERFGRPVPIAVCISGGWIRAHPEDLAWLAMLSREGNLSVTWINHSDTHPYHPGQALEKNFLLSPGVDFRKEVLNTEVRMIENGLTPSPFFRFPGLVSNARLMGDLRRLSLIPVGSDAWLAKGRRPVDGSIILVHGNGNEPQGLALLFELYDRWFGTPTVEHGTLLPLVRAVTAE